MRKKAYNLDQKLKTAIRKVWAFSPVRREALKRVKQVTHEWRCEHCERFTERPYVDHIKAVGLARDWNEFIKMMFTEELQVLCRDCHSTKTKQDLKEMKNANPKRKSR
jgi:Zn finger protein HypA/HybF involved in hydrogenase expression